MTAFSAPPPHPPDLIARASRIKLLGMDVDGVLTAGQIIYLSSGEEIKSYNVKDGHGLWMAGKAGILTAIITGRESPINERRAEELEIHYLFQGIKRKLPIIQRLVAENNLSLDEVAYIGDDLPDLDVLTEVGLACCPSDAVEEVQRACHFITQKPGGHGAVRELTDLILRSKPITPVLPPEGSLKRSS